MELITISKVFVLLMYLEGGYEFGSGVVSAEFNSEGACMDAAGEMANRFVDLTEKRRARASVIFLCTPK